MSEETVVKYFFIILFSIGIFIAVIEFIMLIINKWMDRKDSKEVKDQKEKLKRGWEIP